MPPIDLSKLREDNAKLAAPARTPEPGQVLESATDASATRRALQDARSALNAETAPPGQEPVADPIDQALHAGAQFPRGSDQAMQAYLGPILEAAHAGDPRVAATGVVDSDINRQWSEAAHARQIANRNESGAAHR